MAAVQPSNILETQLYRHFVPHLANSKTRYAIFALGIISSTGLAWQFGKTPLLCTVIPATLFVLAQKNLGLLNISELTAQKKTEKSAQLAYHCFVIAGIWGIVLSGSTLALTYEGGQLLLKGVPSLNLLSIMKGINSLASIGWFWAPLSWYFLNLNNDVLFKNVQNTLQASIEQFLTIIQHEVRSLIEAETLVSRLANFDPAHPPRVNENLKPLLALFTFLRSFGYKSYLPSHIQDDVAVLENQVGEILSKPFPQSLADAQEKLPTLKSKVFAIAKNIYMPPADQEQASEDKANQIFHYILTGALALIPLYVNPLPTAVGLGLGWFYPLGWRSEQRLNQLNTAPRFFEKTLSQKCYFVWEKTYLSLYKISGFSFIGYPSAMAHGFFWSEIIHHYARSKVQKK